MHYVARRSRFPSTSFLPKPSEIESAFLALQPEIEAVRDPVRAQVDVQVASAVAHSVARRDQEPERLARFERLAEAELYDMALPERLGQLSLATWFARQRQLGHVALSSEAAVPPELLRDAQLQRRTMLKVLGHWLDDDPGIVAELAVIREGAGYQDLANDLQALADLYQRPHVRAVIREDRKHYDPKDVRRARDQAQAIFAGLGLGRETDAKRWAQLCLSAWTLLLEAYDEHRAAGTFLFRTLEDVGQSYPSLVSAARRAPATRVTARAEEEDGEGDEDDEGAVAAEVPEAAAG